MLFLLTIFILATFLYFDSVFRIDKKRGQTKSKYSQYTDKQKSRAVMILIMLVVLTLMIGKNYMFGSSSNTSRWDSLSDEEKEWYHNNYGDGQYDDIMDAINNYG